MRRVQLWTGSLLVVLGLAGAASAQTVDNPQYQMWAVWREGTSVTLKTESVYEGTLQSTAKQTLTVKKVTAEKVVLEVSSVTEAGGQTITSPPMTMDIPAKAPKFDGVPEAIAKDTPQDAPKYKQTKGRETLTVSGKKLDCEWTQMEVEGGMVSKMWVCNDVPGQMVKSESSFPSGKSSMVLVELKGGKK